MAPPYELAWLPLMTERERVSRASKLRIVLPVLGQEPALGALPPARVRPEIVTGSPAVAMFVRKIRRPPPPLIVITPAPGPWMSTGSVIARDPPAMSIWPLRPVAKVIVSGPGENRLALSSASR